jgi:hypothetical protein
MTYLYVVVEPGPDGGYPYVVVEADEPLDVGVLRREFLAHVNDAARYRGSVYGAVSFPDWLIAQPGIRVRGALILAGEGHWTATHPDKQLLRSTPERDAVEGIVRDAVAGAEDFLPLYTQAQVFTQPIASELSGE